MSLRALRFNAQCLGITRLSRPGPRNSTCGSDLDYPLRLAVGLFSLSLQDVVNDEGRNYHHGCIKPRMAFQGKSACHTIDIQSHETFDW